MAAQGVWQLRHALAGLCSAPESSPSASLRAGHGARRLHRPSESARESLSRSVSSPSFPNTTKKNTQSWSGALTAQRPQRLPRWPPRQPLRQVRKLRSRRSRRVSISSRRSHASFSPRPRPAPPELLDHPPPRRTTTRSIRPAPSASALPFVPARERGRVVNADRRETRSCGASHRSLPRLCLHKRAVWAELGGTTSIGQKVRNVNLFASLAQLFACNSTASRPRCARPTFDVGARFPSQPAFRRPSRPSW
jgi:hypothetical protein